MRVKTRSHQDARRPGAALLMTIVCLMVIATLAVCLARTLVAEHRQSRWRGNQLQAFWLAESAIERAAARLAATRDYAGEEWQVKLPLSGAAVQARAAIRVESVAGQFLQRRIVVEARCPAEGETSVVEVRESIVTLGPAEDAR